ncbi:MAG TPA: hypothetical protein DDW17_09325 [Deltaproteobacteria bacterium]|nr:hypothetical protein [Deltaproteobacteria bacterium]
MKKKMIEIILNGFKEKVPANITISQLISYINEKDSHVIVEINSKYVFPQFYSSTIVSDGDRVEFINPDFGG